MIIEKYKNVSSVENSPTEPSSLTYDTKMDFNITIITIVLKNKNLLLLKIAKTRHVQCGYINNRLIIIIILI